MHPWTTSERSGWNDNEYSDTIDEAAREWGGLYLCPDCWEEMVPDQYFPEVDYDSDWETNDDYCQACGDTMTVVAQSPVEVA